MRSRLEITPGTIAILVTLITAAMVAAWPFGFTGDYFNHLARNYIEGHLWSDPALRKFYMVSFKIVPDLTMDMTIPWLSHLIGIYAAGAVLAWAGLVAAPIGGVLLARSLHGRVTWPSLAGFLVMFNQNAQWSFVNFSVSCGLALAAFALWVRSRPSWRKTALFCPIGLALVFNHALGFLLFGYLVLLWEIGCWRVGERGRISAFLATLATKTAASMAPALAIVLLATAGGDQLPRGGATSLLEPAKIETLWSAALFGNVALAMLVCLSLVVGLGFGLWRGIIVLDPRMRWACAGIAALVIAMPVVVLGIWGLHFRYPAIAFIAVVASVRFDGQAQRQQRLAMAAAAGLLVAVLLNAAAMMAPIDRQSREMRHVLQKVTAGARVLPVASDTAAAIVTLHLADMAVIERSAFVPDLFTNTSPVGVVPSMRRQHMPQAHPLAVQKLAEARNAPLPDARNGYWSTDFYHGWPRHWDYVVYFHRPADRGLHDPALRLAASTDSVSLYRIVGAPD